MRLTLTQCCGVSDKIRIVMRNNNKIVLGIFQWRRTRETTGLLLHGANDIALFLCYELYQQYYSLNVFVDTTRVEALRCKIMFCIHFTDSNKGRDLIENNISKTFTPREHYSGAKCLRHN